MGMWVVAGALTGKCRFIFFFFFTAQTSVANTHFGLLTLKKPSFLSLKTLCDYKIKSTLKS